MKVDPVEQNYITVRLWGSDVNKSRLLLYCEGMQVGYRHLGDIDLLDIGTDAPFANGRFFYTTLPLPLNLTKGKQQVNLRIQSNGPIWAYGQTFDKYQYPITEPTRGIYKLYTHTQGTFVPPATEKQGVRPDNPPVQQQFGPEVLEEVKRRVNQEIVKLLDSQKPLSQVQMQFLAKAYRVKWSEGYQNPRVVQQVQRSLDAIFAAYRQNPRLAEADPATYNADWFGLGITGQVIHLLLEPLKPALDKQISDGAGGKLTRRAAYTEILLVCRDWHRQHRRLYTNQSMINDLYGIYYANKGLAAINPVKAMPENEVKRYLYESIGLQPWLGSEDEKGVPSKSAGENYMQLTEKGLTKELGYVGNYGEVLDWVAEIYDATRPSPEQPGDTKVKEQLNKIALARTPFRYATVDAAGNKAMRIETIVGWRDTHYPGDVTYVQRSSWDGTPLQVVAATLHPSLVAYAQQMFSENQFFGPVKHHIDSYKNNFRVTAGLLPLPDEYDLIRAQPASQEKLPMAWDQPNFIFSDEENGVVAIKNGQEILYASLYWRARHAVNFLSRVHYITPMYDQIATVFDEEIFEPSSHFFARPDYTNFGFARGGLPYPENMHSAHTGEQLPIARVPADVPYKIGQENVYAGKASFYKLQFGQYLIGMNASTDQTYELEVPAGFKASENLVTKEQVQDVRTVPVAPRTTVVLYSN
ncbi:hypothetical protein [Botryobacter ruber]|uniref:hypothetical protein n=1 Tax=Botryobacter ruber TaxID=2171629 RepID=UPI000FEC24CF|nr:hypothetical protein [Botryobacter ruber]